MPTTSNFGWTTPADTDLVKDGAAAIRTLGNGIDTSLVDLKGGTTGQVLSKASNTDLDFTWSSVDPLTILDAKGDLISATAADTPARLASSGVNGDILTVDTSTATGLKWATPAASGGMTLISENVPSAVTAINFTSISSNYKQLMLTWTHLNHSTTGSRFDLRFNNDSGNNYFRHIFGVSSGALTYNSATNNDAVWGGSTGLFGSSVNGTTGNVTIKGFIVIDNYSSTSKWKDYWGSFSYTRSGAVDDMFHFNGQWGSTSAITSLDIYRNVGTATLSAQTGGSVRLYGIS